MAQQVTATNGGEVAARRYNGGEATRTRPLLRPRADIYETEDSVFVTAEMPGVGPDDLDVTLESGVLTIRGHMPDVAHEGYRQIYAEYAEGDYERVFTISEAIERDAIKATLRDGQLTLELPKTAPAKTKRIQIRAA